MNNEKLMNEAYDRAAAKLDSEFDSFKGDRRADIVKDDVYKVLKQFALEEPEFAEAISQSDKTLSDCCKAVTSGITLGISDHEAYRRAVKFYFPDADVSFSMKVKLNPYEDAKPHSNFKSKVLDISLDDLFDV